jgi:NAD(P)-dependent dehydrogenase (short-subunit alcohol dehydrogenase family)
MAACMSFELKPQHVTALALYPGLVRTEAVLKDQAFFDMSNSESPQFIGRAVAALAADPNVLEKSGKAYLAAALALEYGFTDIDGRQPTPIKIFG